jgi:chromate reductase, NAD(P)H dehydrogenase (quinone)
MGNVTILGISGSLRKGSYNTALIRIAQEECPPGVAFRTADISKIPLYNEDIRLLGDPPPVVLLKEQIRAADALLIATPEYNYSIPGVLKNAIDWVSRPPETSPLGNKPLGIMGAGGMMGTSRAQYHLRQIAVFTNMHSLNKPELFVRRAAEKFDEEGNPRNPMLRDQVRNLVVALLAWTERLREGPPRGIST